MPEQLNLKHAKKDDKKELRKLAFWKLSKGEAPKSVAQQLHISVTTIRNWNRKLKASKNKNIDEVCQEEKRGNKKGCGKTLTLEQEAELQREIIGKTPDEYQYKFALWSSEAVKLHILKKFGIDMPGRTVRHYLQQWGWTPQVPVRRAYEQKPKAVKEWLDETYPKIKEEAAQNNGIIFWADETGVQACENKPRGYAPKGQTPVARIVANKGVRVNMISAINNQGKLLFMFYEKAMNAELFQRFMEQLIKEYHGKKKVYLIVDNLRVHHALCLQDWLKENENELELRYLPSYSPELNPDEYVNNDLKQALNKGEPARGKEKLREQVETHMNRRANEPAVMKKLFRHKRIQYAAEEENNNQL